jgi:hypothetical protein
MESAKIVDFSLFCVVSQLNIAQERHGFDAFQRVLKRSKGSVSIYHLLNALLV